MQVFKTCLKIIQRHWVSLAVYLIIFTVLCGVMSAFQSGEKSGYFEQTKTNVSIINRDGDTALTRALTAYAEQNATLVELADEKETLQDALFYEATDYILYIPKGFTEDFEAGGSMELQKTIRPDAARGKYTDQLFSQFLTTARLYRETLPQLSEEERWEAVQQDLKPSTDVEKVTFGNNVQSDASVETYFSMESYLLLVLLVMGISTLMIGFNHSDLRMRNFCAPIRQRSMNAQIGLCSSIFSLISWGALQLMGFALMHDWLRTADVRIVSLYLLNSLVLMVMYLSIAFLVGIFISSMSVQNVIANILSLCMCFLGGAFVPLEMFNKSMLTVAQFVPTYWYIRNVGLIGDIMDVNTADLSSIWIGMGILLGFTVAVFSVALLMSKLLRQRSSLAGASKTELAF